MFYAIVLFSFDTMRNYSLICAIIMLYCQLFGLMRNYAFICAFIACFAQSWDTCAFKMCFLGRRANFDDGDFALRCCNPQDYAAARIRHPGPTGEGWSQAESEGVLL